jgi:hypothetical protein
VIIDCESCAVRDLACGDCVIGVLLGAPGSREPASAGADVPSGAPKVQLDAPERRALDVLAEQGLVPKLRLVATHTRRTSPGADGGRGVRHTG